MSWPRNPQFITSKISSIVYWISLIWYIYVCFLFLEEAPMKENAFLLFFYFSFLSFVYYTSFLWHFNSLSVTFSFICTSSSFRTLLSALCQPYIQFGWSVRCDHLTVSFAQLVILCQSWVDPGGTEDGPWTLVVLLQKMFQHPRPIG